MSLLKPILNPAEQARLDDLYSYEILDTEKEKDFDELVELACDIAGTPISLISLVDKDRQWFKANKGFPCSEASREVSICAHAIESENNSFIIPDAAQDERFANNVLVTQDPHIRFYAGFPLVTSEGNKLGTLCVIDTHPRMLPPKQIEKLEKIARQAMKLLELHKAHKKLQALREAEAKQRETLERLLQNQRKIMAILAHDTRAPLFSIKELLDMFVKGLIQEQQARQVYDMMLGQTEVTINMIESLVKWGQIHLSLVENKSSAGCLKGIVSNVFKQYAPVAASKAIKLTEDISEAAGLHVNNDLLSFIVRNLVNNAIKYTENGTVKVSGRQEGNAYLLIVSDTGAGMSECTRRSLFQGITPSLAGTRKEHGSGLGLMLINDFVQQMGGKITVESQLLKGTTINISLPCG